MKTNSLHIVALLLIFVVTAFTFHACKKLDRVTKCKLENVTVLNANSIRVKLFVFDLSPDTHSDYGICYSATNATPTIEDGKISFGAIDDTITVSQVIESLTPGTKYYFRGYVLNGEVPQYSLNTLDATTYNLPGATTLAASNITNVSASLKGLVNAGGNTTTVSFEYGTTTGYGQTIAALNPTVEGESLVFAEISGLTSNTVYHYRVKAVSVAGTVYGEDIQFTTLDIVPTIATLPVEEIDATTAVSGGSIAWSGGSDVLAQGVCWSTSQNPTLSDSYTTDDLGSNYFTSYLTGLLRGTTYYVRAYATNSFGTGYGNQVIFTTSIIGTIYQGGLIAYILQPGDPSYVAGETHGLIVSQSIQSSGSEWGCYGTTISGADGTALGTGYQNTIDIEAGCNTAYTAADICANLSLGGYNDWYLPSKDELNILYQNKDDLGGFDGDGYWSSSEYSDNLVWIQYFITGLQECYYKDGAFWVRAVRSF